VLAAIYNAIFDERGVTRDELNIQGGWDDLLVLWDYRIKPECRGLLVRASETAITTFSGQSIISAVAKREDPRYPGLDRTVEEWRQLAFVKIGGKPCLFRNNCALNPYPGQMTIYSRP
jgi:hypothetical protein